METKKLNLQDLENYNGGSWESWACSSGGAILMTAAAAGCGTPATWAALAGSLAISAACEAAYSE